jgi:nucleoside-diphosphate-sugar epimerase
VTGSSGFIGSKLVDSFEEEVAVLDRTRHSLFDEDSLKFLLEDCDLIYHLAGVNAGSGYEPSSTDLTLNNIEGTYNLLRAIKKYCSKPPLFILMSSIHVYDKSQDLFSESGNLGPSSLYGMSKLSQEYLVSQAHQLGILDSVVLRASNIYGGSCRPYYNSAIATFCDQIIKGETIPLFARGDATLDLIYIDDVIRILQNVDILSRDSKTVYNLASGKTFSVKKIIEILDEVSDLEIKTKLIDSPVLNFSINTERLNLALPEFEYTTLEEGLKLTYEEYHGLNK